MSSEQDQDAQIEALFQEIYAEIIHQLNQSEKLGVDKFVNHKNTEIANTVTSILMDEEKHQLSNWESKNIEVKAAKEVLDKLVLDSVFNLRRILIGKKIDEMLKLAAAENNNAVDLESIKDYTELKMKLFDKLNRVV